MVNGAKIKRLRSVKGLTQVQLGELVGISPKMIHFIEKGFRNPTANVLKRIADVLGVKLDELFM
jgi:transcriptional regulator with XRE-family HTH domain